MGFGRYRFRRSFGNVSSQFRGARFDTYPLIPYPTEGRVIDLGDFDFNSSEVPDISGEDNNAVLYSARGINLAGAGYVEMPDVGATKSITVLARSSTDTTLYATDDATQTEDASVALVADGTWQEVTLTFTNAISGLIRLGSDGTSFFSGDLADARCKDASDNLLDQFFLNEHTDVAAGGLDGLPCIGRNGNIGQYIDCAAVVQIAGDVGGLTPPQVLGMDFNQYRSHSTSTSNVPLGSDVNLIGDFSISFKYIFSGAGMGTEQNLLVNNNNNRIRKLATNVIRVQINGSLADYGLVPIEKGLNEITISRIGSDVTVTSNGQSQTLTINANTLPISIIGRASVSIVGNVYDINLNNQAAYLGYGRTPWDDTIGSNDGTEVGAFDNLLVSNNGTNEDALGSPIQLPRSSKTFNADESGRWEITDDASLATCQSWSCRYYHTPGESAVILNLGGPTIEATALDALSSTGITGPVYYVNGAAGTALSDGWNSICVTTATPTDCGPIAGDDPTELLSDVKVYNLQLTADQVATLP